MSTFSIDRCWKINEKILDLATADLFYCTYLICHSRKISGVSDNNDVVMAAPRLGMVTHQGGNVLLFLN